MRLVIDTNVVVSILAGRGVLSRLAGELRSGRLQPVVSSALAEEYLRVLARPKFGIGHEGALAILEAVVLCHAEMHDPMPEFCVAACRDAKDDMLVALARSANVPLVSGDGDVHALVGTLHQLVVWRPAELRQRLDDVFTG